MSARTNATTIDYPLLLAVVSLVLVGLLMVYSATFHLRSDPAYFLKRQVVWVALGAVLLVAASQVDYDLMRRLAVPIMGLSVLSLGLVLIMAGGTGNTHSWLSKGSIQPSELAKVAFIIYVAAWLSSKGDRIRDVTYGLIPFSIMLGLVTGLILLQPDKGTALLIAGVALTMFFMSGAELAQLLVGMVVATAAVLVLLIRSDYALTRLLTWFDESAVSADAAFQVHGAVDGLRAGGLTGRGLGAGVQKYIPPYVYHTDTVFSVIGEELGLLGCLLVVGLLLFVVLRGLAISLRAPDAFGTLLAFGLSWCFALQAIVHIGGNTGTLPFTGITLPFISYGGSSLTMSLAGVGLLLNVSRAVEYRKVSVAAFAFGGRDGRPRLSGTRSSRTYERGRKR